MKWLGSMCLLMITMLSGCSDSDDYPGLLYVDDFGSNPGNLLMYYHASSTATADAPLVVVMHGCSQNAADAAELSGWNQLADRYGFHVLYPEQRTVNNISECFNWFDEDDIVRDGGEAKSIASMIWCMKQKFSIDQTHVFVTGLSAGGAMTPVMMAAYPDIVHGGAVMSGGPYYAATDIIESASALLGNVTKSSISWGNLVRAQNTGGWSYGPIAIYHGENDDVVNPTNARELVKQWTNVHGIDDVPDATISQENAPDVTRIEYHNANAEAPVVWFRINDMGHALAVDPGACRNQGGVTGTFGTDKNFYSSYSAAEFFGLIAPSMVSGPSSIGAGLLTVFTAPYYLGSTYQWLLPDGCVVSGPANNAIVTVMMGSASGQVAVTETDSLGCSYYPTPLTVIVN